MNKKENNYFNVYNNNYILISNSWRSDCEYDGRMDLKCAT